jgi:hypothetical protein
MSNQCLFTLNCHRYIAQLSKKFRGGRLVSLQWLLVSLASRRLGGAILLFCQGYFATERGENGISVVAALLEVGRGLKNALLALGEALERF